MRSTYRRSALVLLGAGLLLSGSAAAQDPAQVSPEIYKVIFENPQVRVLDIHLPPGAKTALHSHPSYIAYSLTDSKVRFTSPDGKSVDVPLKIGEAIWRDAESHIVENLGATEVHALNIEFKSLTPSRHEHLVVKPDDLQWQAGPPTLPPGAQMALLEGDPAKPGPFAIRIKAPAGYRIPPHWHPADEHVTVLSGSLLMGMGDKFDKSNATVLPAGSFTVMPATMHHFAWFDEATVIQLHGMGPWGITYVNPADDPQKRPRE